MLSKFFASKLQSSASSLFSKVTMVSLNSDKTPKYNPNIVSPSPSLLIPLESPCARSDHWRRRKHRLRNRVPHRERSDAGRRPTRDPPPA